MAEPRGEDETSVYERVGGRPTFARIAGAFFDGVRRDEHLARLYAHDMDGAQERLMLFLEQFWGGPPVYSHTRGTPRLKMRHMAFKITPQMRDRWVACMEHAVTTVDLPEDIRARMRDHTRRGAQYLVNAD